MFEVLRENTKNELILCRQDGHNHSFVTIIIDLIVISNIVSVHADSIHVTNCSVFVKL